MRQLHADPEFRAAHAERMRQLHADPEFRAKLVASRTDDPVRIAAAAQACRPVAAFAREHGVPRDIADDALFLMEEEGLTVPAAIAAAWDWAMRDGL